MRKFILSVFLLGCFFIGYTQSKTTQVSFSGYVDGHYVQASGTLKYKFKWVFFPEVDAEFKDLVITRIDYNNVQYDAYKNNSKINFPYSVKGYPTKTEIKCSMPYGGFESVNKLLYTTTGYVGFDFSSSSFNQKFNAESATKKKEIQATWENKPYVSEVKIISLSDRLINNIIDDIERVIEHEEKEKERLRKEKEKEDERLKEQEKQKKEEEEQKKKEEKEKEEKRQDESSGGGNSKKKKKDKDKPDDSKSDEKEEEEYSSTIDADDAKFRSHADAHYKARQAEANGNISQAIYWYKIANSYVYNMETANKIKNLETQQDINAVANGATTFITGFNDAFSDLEDGRIEKLIYTSTYHYGKSDFLESPASKGSKGHLEAHMSFDYYMWLVRQKLGFHLRLSGSFSEGQKKQDSFGSDDDWTFDFSKLELGGSAGLNLFGFFEVDYLYRGLMLKGEYSYPVPNTTAGFGLRYIDVPFGGKLHFDGGLYAALYLARKKKFMVRVSGWYVNGSEEGMLGMLDPKSSDKVTSTQSNGFRLELVKTPWCFGVFRSKNVYNNPTTNTLSVNTWGIGLLFGAGN